MPSTPTLVTEGMAAYWTGRPGSTIRRWATEGRVRRYGKGRGNVRYNLRELPAAQREEDTGRLLKPGDPPARPDNSRAA